MFGVLCSAFLLLRPKPNIMFWAIFGRTCSVAGYSVHPYGLVPRSPSSRTSSDFNTPLPRPNDPHCGRPPVLTAVRPLCLPPPGRRGQAGPPGGGPAPVGPHRAAPAVLPAHHVGPLRGGRGALQGHPALRAAAGGRQQAGDRRGGFTGGEDISGCTADV